MKLFLAMRHSELNGRKLKQMLLFPNMYSISEISALWEMEKLFARATSRVAVDTCAKAGGSRVVVPPGKYLTGPIFLKSNLEFEVLSGATLLGSTNFDDYPTMQGRWEGSGPHHFCFVAYW